MAERKRKTPAKEETAAEKPVETVEAPVVEEVAEVVPVSTAVAAEKGEREAADSALSNRIKVYEDKFGGASDLLVFNCGDSESNI